MLVTYFCTKYTDIQWGLHKEQYVQKYSAYYSTIRVKMECIRGTQTTVLQQSW